MLCAYVSTVKLTALSTFHTPDVMYTTQPVLALSPQHLQPVLGVFLFVSTYSLPLFYPCLESR